MSLARGVVALSSVFTFFALPGAKAVAASAGDYLWADSAEAGGALVASSPAHGLEARLGAHRLVVRPAQGE